jgi:hypothetical protein
MWICPACQVYMKLDEAVCIKCTKPFYYFEGVKKIQLEKMII